MIAGTKRAVSCKRCGAGLAPDAQFCAGCGLNVVEAETQRYALREARERRRHIDERQMIFIALVFLVALAYFATHH